VLDPKLSVCFLQEGVDRHSTRTSLLLVELERRDAIQSPLRRIVIEIAGQYDPAGLASFTYKNLVPGVCPGADLMMTLPSPNTFVFIVLEDDRLASARPEKVEG